MKFRDRTHAGQELALKLEFLRGRKDLLVLGLPRGGVPVAHEVAQHLHAPLDVFVVRKLGVPGHEELAMGAIASGGALILNDPVVAQLRLGRADIEHVIVRELRELARREQSYRGGATPPDIRAHTVILVDDGLATGSTMRAAVSALRKLGATRIVVAVPVSSPDTCADLGLVVDDIVCAETPEPFYAVGEWYEDFSQTTDAEVHDLLERATRRRGAAAREPS